MSLLLIFSWKKRIYMTWKKMLRIKGCNNKVYFRLYMLAFCLYLVLLFMLIISDISLNFCNIRANNWCHTWPGRSWLYEPTALKWICVIIIFVNNCMRTTVCKNAVSSHWWCVVFSSTVHYFINDYVHFRLWYVYCRFSWWSMHA